MWGRGGEGRRACAGCTVKTYVLTFARVYSWVCGCLDVYMLVWGVWGGVRGGTQHVLACTSDLEEVSAS